MLAYLTGILRPSHSGPRTPQGDFTGPNIPHTPTGGCVAPGASSRVYEVFKTALINGYTAIFLPPPYHVHLYFKFNVRARFKPI